MRLFSRVKRVFREKEKDEQLITPSILNSVSWAKAAPGTIVPPKHGGDGALTWAQKAFDDLKSSLRREERGEPSEAIKLGLHFEDLVYRWAPFYHQAALFRRTSKEFRGILKEASGGEYQKRLSRSLTVDDEDYLVYGRADIFFKDRIIDIKTTGKNRPPEYYLKGSQHLAYLYCTELLHFRYRVVVIGEDLKITKTYPVDFKGMSCRNIERQLKDRIRGFREFLSEHGLLGEYHDFFCAKRR